jgi:hypothetical protein
MVGRERVDVHERLDEFVVRGGLGDDESAVGVTGQDDGPADPVDDGADVGGVTGDAAQRVGHRDHLERARPEYLDDAVPAGRFRERAVHQYDDRLLLRHGPVLLPVGCLRPIDRAAGPIVTGSVHRADDVGDHPAGRRTGGSG